ACATPSCPLFLGSGARVPFVPLSSSELRDRKKFDLDKLRNTTGKMPVGPTGKMPVLPANGLVEKKLRAGGSHHRDRGLADKRVLYFPAGERLSVAVRRVAISPHGAAGHAARQGKGGGCCFAETASTATMDFQRALRPFCSRKAFHRGRLPACHLAN